MSGVSISDFIAQCKTRLEQWLLEWGIAIIVILVAGISFGLGRLSATEDRAPVVATQTIVASSSDEQSIPARNAGGDYVAARTGKVYYFPWCAAASHIAEANKIWFKTEIAAKAAGYTPAKNCKGLVNSAATSTIAP